MINKPLVSAIVSTYNSEKFMRGKIEDLLSQTIVNKLDIIIINSGSKQNEDKIITEYLSEYPNIKYVKTVERETIYEAWNRGIKIAQGEFITNSNTDDRLRKDAYEILSNYLLNNSSVALVYGDQLISSIENQEYDEAVSNKVIRFPNYTHLKQLERCIVGSQPMWRASLHLADDIWFNGKYEVSGDHEFELRISEKYEIHHLNKVLGTFYKSPSKSNKEYENMERTKKEINEITSNYLKKYVNNFSLEELKLNQRNYKYQLMLPILLYEFCKRCDKKLSRGIYPKLFFHSIEFIYYFNIEMLLRLGEFEKVSKLCRKYLRFKTSDRIQKIYNEISAEDSSSET